MWKAESLSRASVAYADGLLYVHGWNVDVALVEAPLKWPIHSSGSPEA
jgi:hypothetical protein